MKKLSIAILGCGTRGSNFAMYMLEMPEKYEIVALCDVNPEQIRKTQKLCNVNSAKVYLDPLEFLQEKHADVIIIATPDREHIPQVVKALNLGYDVLVEKPLSDSREELDILKTAQEKTGRKVVVCHELRYGAGYRKCAELIKSGIIGKLYAIDASERVWYAHWAQAYVRGIGASIELGHPAILAKCSHDLDLLQYYAGSHCDTISSIGELSFFVPENAPEGAADRCLECIHQESCVYSAKKIYVDLWHEMGEPEWRWPFNKVSLDKPHTEEKIRAGLKDGEYGACAFKCKVEKVDHQFVQMKFENGVKASLKMVYAAEAGRKLIFYGNYGEITFDERTNEIQVMPYGGKNEIVDVNALIVKEDQSHGGGDAVLIEELYDVILGNRECTTPLDDSIEAHLMGIAAEESRKLSGQLIKVHQL